MYQSPIEICMGNLHSKIENEIFRAVQEVGISVDREELIKAIQYDRDQYYKGYDDARRETSIKLKRLVDLYTRNANITRENLARKIYEIVAEDAEDLEEILYG